MRRLLVIALLATACEKPAPPPAPPAAKPVALPTIEQATTLVSTSPEFSDYQFTNAAYSLPMKNPPADIAKSLQRAGWINVDGAGNVVLTSKAKSDRRWLVRPNGFTDIVPLAKKEFGAATAVRNDPDGAAVDFTWKWIGNEIGDAFLKDRYAGEQKATATLIRSGDDWTVLRIRPVQ